MLTRDGRAQAGIHREIVRAAWARLEGVLLSTYSHEARCSRFGSEVYLRMLRVPDTEAILNPEAYLYTVAANLLKENAVADRRQASAMDLVDVPEPEVDATAWNLDGSVDKTRRNARLLEVLEQLPPKCRAAVVLQYRDELSYQQIAERLGVSPHMVKKYLMQALSHCRRRMARFG